MRGKEARMSNNPRFGFVLEYVADVEVAKQFYTDVLGLEVQRYHPSYVQFEHFAVASDESMSGLREPEVYWLVEDADAAFADLSQRAEVSMPVTQMPFGKVFGIKDPAGRPKYLLEFAKDRPSQAVS
jgi:predicted enzyme related to lactoylglutathione lyase